MGLPSGTLWADRNVGAIDPRDFGLKFQWSQTTSDTNYNVTELSKKYNTTDGLTTLELEDDAAYVNMGTRWRMPTETEFQELKDYTTIEWKYNKPYCYIGVELKSKVNNNTLYFPTIYSSSYRYWTSSVSSVGLDGWAAVDVDFVPCGHIHFEYGLYKTFTLTIRGVVRQ